MTPLDPTNPLYILAEAAATQNYLPVPTSNSVSTNNRAEITHAVAIRTIPQTQNRMHNKRPREQVRAKRNSSTYPTFYQMFPSILK